jgi:hypothetical protein
LTITQSQLAAAAFSLYTASLNIEVAGVTGQQISNANKQLGETCVFGDAIGGERCLSFTETWRVTGLSRRGWFWRFFQGTPKKVNSLMSVVCLSIELLFLIDRLSAEITFGAFCAKRRDCCRIVVSCRCQCQ